MATTHVGWENRIAMVFERPLGTTDSTGFLWVSSDADSMGLGAEATRRQVYGNRYLLNPHLQVLKSNPGGDLGATAFWFDTDGTQTNLNRILNSHFQNTYEICPIEEICYVAHFPVSEQPGTLSGWSIARDIGLGLGTSYLWSSCVANKLEVSWAPGRPVELKPSFLALDGQPAGSCPGLIATDTAYQDFLYQAPNIAVTWNGTTIQTAGFKVESDNQMNVKHDPSSLSPVGFTMGRFSANLELKVWVDDDFFSDFVPDYLGSGVSPTDQLGTFQALISGPNNGDGETYTSTIYFYGKIVDMPSGQPNDQGIQTIKVEMTSPDTGTKYTDAGYYIRVRGSSVVWQTPS